MSARFLARTSIDADHACPLWFEVGGRLTPAGGLFKQNVGRLVEVGEFPGFREVYVDASVFEMDGEPEVAVEFAVEGENEFRSLLLPADVEYAQWANPKSECVYF